MSSTDGVDDVSSDWPPPTPEVHVISEPPVAPEIPVAPVPPPTAGRPATWLAATLLLVLVFIVGILVGQSGALGGRPQANGPQSTPPAAASGSPSGSSAPSGSPNANTTNCDTGAYAIASPVLPAEAPSDFDLFWQALACVRQNYVGRSELKDTDLTYGAIRGMMEALGDTGHSIFLSPDALASEQQSLDGTVVGIGALLGVKGGVPIIVSVIGGGPAEKAGLRAGDQIVSVNGEKVSSLPPDEVAAKIRGAEGTQVVVEIVRPATGEDLTFTMIREKLNFPSASWTFIPGTHIADLRLIQFSSGAAAELKKARDDAVAQGATAFVLDLRSNPGGFVPEAVDTASLFLDHKTVYISEDANAQKTPVGTDDKIPPSSLPMVVLIDAGTASSAEIVAAGIGSNGRGQLVGETTFGTGTVLQTHLLADGSAVRVAFERWLTPDGQLIFGQGIKPTVEVAMPNTGRALEPQEIAQLTPDQIPTMEDAQLLKGLQLLEAAGAQ